MAKLPYEDKFTKTYLDKIYSKKDKALFLSFFFFFYLFYEVLGENPVLFHKALVEIRGIGNANQIQDFCYSEIRLGLQ